MRILISAYACAPDRGSECAVGMRAVEAAASRHDVWVLTQPEMAADMGRAISRTPLGARVTIVPIPPDVTGSAGGLRGLVAEHRRHDEWQRNAARVAAVLDSDVDFDVVHHVTLAAYWLRVGVATLDKPLVLGPVGGGVEPPLRLLPVLGVKGAAEAAVRTLARRAIANRLHARVAHGAAVVFAQNPETAARIDPAIAVNVLPNPLAVSSTEVPALHRGGDILFVGRLIPWKGAALAVQAMRSVRSPDAVLRVVGAGRDAERIQRLVRRYGLTDRVVFEGLLPHAEVLRRVARAGVLLHPALHEEGGFAVAEALAMGTPVVALGRGGPAELVRLWPQAPSAVVRPSSPARTARALAASVDRFLRAPAPIRHRALEPTRSFGDDVLAAYDVAAAQRTPRQQPTAPAASTPVRGAGAA